MEEKIKNKFKRFVELSKEFSIKNSEIYPMDSLQSFSMSGSYSISSNDAPRPSLLEQFTKSQNEKIKKAERFEEYLELQSQLSSYFSAVKNLEQ